MAYNRLLTDVMHNNITFQVTFDIDTNGILNVSARDNSTGRSEGITIANDKGRLSKKDIEKMLHDAEKYKSEDDAVKKKVELRNQLEGYIFGCKTVSADFRIDK